MFFLVSTADPSFASPVLNRANSRLSLGEYESALADYKQYLVLDPASSQRREVESMIMALQNEIAYQEQEQERIAAEEERIRAENERLAAEKAEQERIEAERIAAERAAEEERIRAENERIAETIEKIHTESPDKGYRRIRDDLERYHDIKVNDKLDFENVYERQGEVVFTEDSKVYVIRNIHGDELRNELLKGEIDFDVEDTIKNGNNYILKGQMIDWNYTTDEDEAEKFELEIIVNNNTQILGITGNPEEQLKRLNNIIYVTFDKDELRKGNFVATNIETMGC